MAGSGLYLLSNSCGRKGVALFGHNIIRYVGNQVREPGEVRFLYNPAKPLGGLQEGYLSLLAFYMYTLASTDWYSIIKQAQIHTSLTGQPMSKLRRLKAPRKIVCR